MQCFFNSNATIDLVLGNPSKLCAKRGQNWIDDRLDICVKHTLNSLRLNVDHHDWKFNNFVGFQCPFFLFALALEVVHTYVIERRRVQVLTIFKVKD